MDASVYTCTHLGGAHDRNQDRALVASKVLAATRGIESAEVHAPAMLGVFDGLGGHAAGDVASEMAARLVAETELPRDETSLVELLRHADRLLLDATRDHPEHAGMGTTAAVMLLPEDGVHALVANVGDSTVWRQRGQQVEELSVSDRWQGSGVLQCLGANDDGVAPHVRLVDLTTGDRVLVATDGLTDVVPADLLRSTLDGDTGQAAERLLALVEQAGFPDDVTFVVADLH